jgi:pSer/pThr/pTyr-binding forkhead associated (FHA) protein
MPTAPGDETADALALFGVQAGPRSGEEIAIRAPVLTIGKGSQNDVVLADDSVSTTHARLEYATGYWRLTDLGSTNGTYVDNTRLAPNVPTAVAYGAQVRFGGLRLQFREVPTADPDTARATYTPPPPPRPIAERGSGLRIPLWVFLVLLIVIAAIAYFAFGASAQPGPGPVGVAAALAPTPPGIP